MNRRLYAKGKRGLIYLACYKGKKIIIKKKNPKSAAPGRIEIEAQFLKKVNRKGIGPKFIYFKGNELAMEYINGVHFTDYMKTQPKDKMRKVVMLLEKQVKALDKLKINKYEMSRPFRNVIIRNDKPVMIDFERCKYSPNPKNLRQFQEFKKRLEQGLFS
ncbi:hypothetical protein GF323_05695 [Candidatus Woesearchaeota archaeon]|nr:hypothetical protein [Candidatus Woesearchaeota archaeon]